MISSHFIWPLGNHECAYGRKMYVLNFDWKPVWWMGGSFKDNPFFLFYHKFYWDNFICIFLKCWETFWICLDYNIVSEISAFVCIHALLVEATAGGAFRYTSHMVKWLLVIATIANSCGLFKHWKRRFQWMHILHWSTN